MLSIMMVFSIFVADSTNCHACTSMIVGAKASKSGRPMLWKNRDTGTEHNFVEKTPARDGHFAYVALYNGGDSTLRDAWIGMNEQGFAIMNTASYNLAPDTTDYKDREGIVMALALQRCSTIDDFKCLLDTLPKPLGVQANFGVIDAYGGGAYFECDDYKYTPYYLADTDDDILIRTNFSFSGNDTDGYGYIRYENAKMLTAVAVAKKSLTPADFTEGCSKSFFHSLKGVDYESTTDRWIVDQDFIPRRSTSASVVIEGIAPGGDPSECVMWTVIGYPPCSHAIAATVTDVPECLRPTATGWRSTECNSVLQDKYKAFPIKRGSGPHYIDMNYLRNKMKYERTKSFDNYENFNRNKHNNK